MLELTINSKNFNSKIPVSLLFENLDLTENAIKDKNKASYLNAISNRTSKRLIQFKENSQLKIFTTDSDTFNISQLRLIRVSKNYFFSKILFKVNGEKVDAQKISLTKAMEDILLIQYEEIFQQYYESTNDLAYQSYIKKVEGKLHPTKEEQIANVKSWISK
jgi:hypothetical protein